MLRKKLYYLLLIFWSYCYAQHCIAGAQYSHDDVGIYLQRYTSCIAGGMTAVTFLYMTCDKEDRSVCWAILSISIVAILGYFCLDDLSEAYYKRRLFIEFFAGFGIGFVAYFVPIVWY